MQPEDYLEFERTPTNQGEVEEVRIKGSRILIEHVLGYYQKGLTAEAIKAEVYPSLSLQEIEAAIHYYLQNKMEVDRYLERGRAITEANYQEYLKKGPSPVAKRLRELSAAKEAASRSE
jgi:uncharacterized protein (DUF433 family)